MSWRTLIDTLRGRKVQPALPPAGPGRVHRIADDLEAEDITAPALAKRVGISRAGAYLRLQQARETGDFSRIFDAPRGDTSATAATAAQKAPTGRKKGARTMGKTSDSTKDDRGQRIMKLAEEAGDRSVGIAMVKTGVSIEDAEKFFASMRGEPGTFGALIGDGNEPASIAARVLAAGEKAGLGRATGGRR